MDEEPEQRSQPVQEDLIQSILRNLSDITKQTREDETFKAEIAKQLENIGYDHFDENEDERNPEHVLKILQVAMRNTMSSKLELKQEEADDDDEEEADKNDGTLGKKLEKLFEINDGKCLDDYFTKGWEATLPKARSPLDLAKHVKKSAPLWFLKNLIKHQFSFKWATETGLPSSFTYYDFCEAQGTLKHLKYKPRKAQIKVELYHESLKRSPSELQLSEEELCPLVYVKTTEGWKTWEAKGRNVGVVRSNEEFKWINEPIRSYILENADDMRGDNEGDQNRKEETNLEKALDKAALYWVVIHDDFHVGSSSQLKEISHTQVCMLVSHIVSHHIYTRVNIYTMDSSISSKLFSLEVQYKGLVLLKEQT